MFAQEAYSETNSKNRAYFEQQGIIGQETSNPYASNYVDLTNKGLYSQANDELKGMKARGEYAPPAQGVAAGQAPVQPVVPEQAATPPTENANAAGTEAQGIFSSIMGAAKQGGATASAGTADYQPPQEVSAPIPLQQQGPPQVVEPQRLSQDEMMSIYERYYPEEAMKYRETQENRRLEQEARRENVLAQIAASKEKADADRLDRKDRHRESLDLKEALAKQANETRRAISALAAGSKETTGDKDYSEYKKQFSSELKDGTQPAGAKPMSRWQYDQWKGVEKPVAIAGAKASQKAESDATQIAEATQARKYKDQKQLEKAYLNNEIDAETAKRVAKRKGWKF